MRIRITALGLVAFLTSATVRADSPLKELLTREIIGPKLAQVQVEDYCEARVPVIPADISLADWQKLALELSKDQPRNKRLSGKPGSSRRKKRRTTLRRIVAVKEYPIDAKKVDSAVVEGLEVTH